MIDGLRSITRLIFPLVLLMGWALRSGLLNEMSVHDAERPDLPLTAPL
jgi:hypothetical protein